MTNGDAPLDISNKIVIFHIHEAWNPENTTHF